MNNLTIENARIIYRNFAGAESKYNLAGRRNFSVILEEDLASRLREDGWNVKPLKKRDDSDVQRYHLPVAVVFGPYPPKIIVLQGNRKSQLTDDTVAMLDWADLENVDLIIRPRIWERGIKAYLKCGYFTVEENELDKKYAHLDDDDLPF